MMLIYLNAFSTVLSFAVFLGIVWWAFSKHRKQANEEAANLPFALPDEVQSNNKEVDRP